MSVPGKRFYCITAVLAMRSVVLSRAYRHYGPFLDPESPSDLQRVPHCRFAERIAYRSSRLDVATGPLDGVTVVGDGVSIDVSREASDNPTISIPSQGMCPDVLVKGRGNLQSCTTHNPTVAPVNPPTGCRADDGTSIMNTGVRMIPVHPVCRGAICAGMEVRCDATHVCWYTSMDRMTA